MRGRQHFKVPEPFISFISQKDAKRTWIHRASASSPRFKLLEIHPAGRILDAGNQLNLVMRSRNPTSHFSKRAVMGVPKIPEKNGGCSTTNWCFVNLGTFETISILDNFGMLQPLVAMRSSDTLQEVHRRSVGASGHTKEPLQQIFEAFRQAPSLEAMLAQGFQDN